MTHHARIAAAALVAAAVFLGVPAGAQEEEEGDPAEVVIGERLFLETRFAEYFLRQGGGDVNGRSRPAIPSSPPSRRPRARVPARSSARPSTAAPATSSTT